jgi:hypothetical protein
MNFFPSFVKKVERRFREAKWLLVLDFYIMQAQKCRTKYRFEQNDISKSPQVD